MTGRIAIALCCCCCGFAPSPSARGATDKPNIVLILCDDLGYAEVGCYGQQKIATPNIDRLAAEGMRFTNFYAGSPVCAPSRCTLLTGKHTGHAAVRDNEEIKPEGQYPIPPDTITLGNVLHDAGYVTACIGKWGLGGPGSTGVPERHGFDHFYGHLCQRVAHNHYTDHLWRDAARLDLAGNTEGNLVGRQYAPDLMADDAIEFIKSNRDKTFFLYFATPLPHVALQVPADAMAPYLGAWGDETPYDGKKGYLPNPTPHAAYAGMVSRIDAYVGRIMATLKELNLDDSTLVLFTSDNGPTFIVGGADSAFFHSAGPLRGLKQDVYEGGIRVPLIVRWPGHVKAGASSDFGAAFWDVLPTCADVARASTPRDLDGLSLAPTLLQRGQQLRHEYLYWEYHSQGDSQAVRMDDWKAVRTHVRNHFADAPIELYNLSGDIGEQRDVSAEHPDIVARMKQVMTVTARTESENPRWNFKPATPAKPAAR